MRALFLCLLLLGCHKPVPEVDTDIYYTYHEFSVTEICGKDAYYKYDGSSYRTSFDVIPKRCA